MLQNHTSGQIVRLTGNPHVPVVVKLTNAASVALYGEFQYKIIDKSIGSKEVARPWQGPKLLLRHVKDEGSFSTYEKV